MKIDKRELILSYIIEAYLDENSPIGSSELRARMDDPIPASTIRVYFKKLSDEGALRQLHISGGRIPTYQTMQNHWLASLDFGKKLSINSEILDEILDDFKIYCLIFENSGEKLEEVINYSHKFIILNFSRNEFILKFDERVYKFLLNLVGTEIDELITISAQIGLSELRAKLNLSRFLDILYMKNETLVYEMFGDKRFKLLLDPNFSRKFGENLTFSPLFENEYMGVKREVLYESKNATMLCAGSVYEDWKKFFDSVEVA